MNIWIEGVDGAGKTTLAVELGKVLGVTPLYHITHEQLPEGQPYNVIDRHAAITNCVYKKTLPDRFCDVPDIKGEMLHTDEDLYVYLEHSPLTDRLVEDYTSAELARLDAGYRNYFRSHMCNLVKVTESSNTLRIADYASDPLFKRCVLVERDSKPQVALQLKVREILRITREMER